MALGEIKNPYMGFRFNVEIDGLLVGGFSEVSGLSAETEMEEYREGGINNFIYKTPKITKYPNLVLKRGIGFSDVLWSWYQDVINGEIKPKQVHIYLNGNGTDKQLYWVFKEAYPIKWTGADLKADANSVALETLELFHKGFEKV